MTRTIDKPAFPRLDEYQRKLGFDDRKLAEHFNVSARTIPRWRHMDTTASLAKVQEVFMISDGFIRLLDWPTDYTRQHEKEVRKVLGRRAGTTKTDIKTPTKRARTPRAGRAGKKPKPATRIRS